MNPGIKVFAPASVSNLACGFDIIGLAIDAPGDEVIVRFSEKPGLVITKITGAKGKLSSEISKNTAGYAALQLLKHLGKENLGIEMELHKKMAIGTGLGSSAASAVAGVVAVNELLKRPLERRALLPFAIDGEFIASKSRHADNIAPSLLGGIVFIRDQATLDIHRVPSPKGLYIVVILPQVQILTSEARNILSPTVTLKAHIQQSANLGGLILGLYNSDLGLISRSLKDVIIEPQRAKLIPHFYEVQKAALEKGALGCSISGSGPSIFALCSNSLESEQVAKAMGAVYEENKIAYKTFISPVNNTGAQLK